MIRRFPSISPQSISAAYLTTTPSPSEFFLVQDKDNKLWYTTFSILKDRDGPSELPFLNLKSQTFPALVEFNECLHTVFVHDPSGKLRHVQFDEARLK